MARSRGGSTRRSKPTVRTPPNAPSVGPGDEHEEIRDDEPADRRWPRCGPVGGGCAAVSPRHHEPGARWRSLRVRSANRRWRGRRARGPGRAPRSRARRARTDRVSRGGRRSYRRTGAQGRAFRDRATTAIPTLAARRPVATHSSPPGSPKDRRTSRGTRRGPPQDRETEPSACPAPLHGRESRSRSGSRRGTRRPGRLARRPSTASVITPRTSAYFFASFGTVSLMPSRSWMTSTWPSVAAAGADPDRRDLELSRDLGAELGRHRLERRSRTRPPSRAGARARGRARRPRRVPAPCTRRALDGLRRQSDVRHRRDPDVGQPTHQLVLGSLELDRVGAPLLDQPSGVAHAVLDRAWYDMNGMSPTTIARRRRGRPPSVWWSMSSIVTGSSFVYPRTLPADRVADQQHRNAGLVEDLRGREVVGGEHREPRALGLPRRAGRGS